MTLEASTLAEGTLHQLKPDIHEAKLAGHTHLLYTEQNYTLVNQHILIHTLTSHNLYALHLHMYCHTLQAVCFKLYERSGLKV